MFQLLRIESFDPWPPILESLELPTSPTPLYVNSYLYKFYLIEFIINKCKLREKSSLIINEEYKIS